MTFWEEEKFKKPERWGFDRGSTDPKWEWAHRKADIIWPMWTGAGLTVPDLSKDNFAGAFVAKTGAGPTWARGIHGVELDFTRANEERVEAPAATSTICAAQCTVLAVHRIADETNTQEILTCSTSGTGLSLALEFGRTDNKYSALRNHSVVTLTGATAFSIPQVNVIALRFKGTTSDWTADLFVNGISDASATTSSNPTGASNVCTAGALKAGGSAASQ